MRIIFVLLFFLKIFSASSQNLNFYGFIPSFSQHGVLSNRIDYNFFTSITNSAHSETTRGIKYPASLLQIYIQPSIIYKFKQNLNFGASITYNYQRSNPIANYFNEWRGWQQLVFAHNFITANMRISHRTRFEERFIKYVNDKYRLTTRLRYQIAFLFPFKGPTLDPAEFYINSYNEIYCSLSNPSSLPRNAFFSEDWIYFGIGYQTKRLGRIELGPLYQTNVRNRLGERRNLNLLQILWAVNFNHQNKKS